MKIVINRARIAMLLFGLNLHFLAQKLQYFLSQVAIFWPKNVSFLNKDAKFGQVFISILGESL